MEFATFAYAWDLLDEGVEVAANRLDQIGIDEVNVATNYHSTQTYNPRNPARSTFFTHARSYFQPREKYYGELQPIPNESMDDSDWINEIAEAIDNTSITLNSWTIGCHNSALGMANKDLCIQNPFGDQLVFGLCPSKPEVQNYLKGLLTDLSSRNLFGRIELETFDYFYGTGFGWHHDKFHTKLGSLGEFLFGLCFCTECTTIARDAGVAVEQARKQAKRTINLLAEGDLSPTINEAGWFATHPELFNYAKRRMKTLSSLYSEFHDTIDGPELGRYIANGVSPEDSWKQGLDIETIDNYVDYYLPLAYGETPEESLDIVRSTQALTEREVHAGVLPAHPLITDQVSLEEVVDGLYECGVERISFYNYGLLPEQSLDWIKAATAPYV